jgi:hypothetical protein
VTTCIVGRGVVGLPVVPPPRILAPRGTQAEIFPRTGGETRTAPKLSSALAAFNRRRFFMGHLASGGAPFWRDRYR